MRVPGPATTDGDGWVRCACGHRHWGRVGAAGLLLHAGERVLMQHRASWSHEGGTWGVPGGARARGEDGMAAALREATEEAGVPPAVVHPWVSVVDEHGPWSYTTVVAEAGAPVEPVAADAESVELRWVTARLVETLPLHPGFAAAWRDLVGLTRSRLVLVVDVANVMGARPDGWWRDRAGAAGRLLSELDGLARTGLEMAEPLNAVRVERWWPQVVAVVEGAARDVQAPDSVETVRTGGSGDDAVVAQVRERLQRRPEDRVRVVTADRELRARVEACGAEAWGPRALLDSLRT